MIEKTAEPIGVIDSAVLLLRAADAARGGIWAVNAGL